MHHATDIQKFQFLFNVEKQSGPDFLEALMGCRRSIFFKQQNNLNRRSICPRVKEITEFSKIINLIPISSVQGGYGIFEPFVQFRGPALHTAHVACFLSDIP